MACTEVSHFGIRFHHGMASSDLPTLVLQLLLVGCPYTMKNQRKEKKEKIMHFFQFGMMNFTLEIVYFKLVHMYVPEEPFPWKPFPFLFQ